MSKNCPHLEYLNVLSCYRITPEGLEKLINLASAPNLKQLHVRKVQYFSCLEKMKKDLPNLKIVIKKCFKYKGLMMRMSTRNEDEDDFYEFENEDDSYDSEDGTDG